MGEIRCCSMDHVSRYGEIYAKAFSGEPWNDPWKPEDAVIHVKEILEMKQSYGLEYVEDNIVVGFLLGSSMLFHYQESTERMMISLIEADFDENDQIIGNKYKLYQVWR